MPDTGPEIDLENLERDLKFELEVSPEERERIYLADWLESKSKLTVTDDLMQASITVGPPPENHEYTVELLQGYLAAKRITYGVRTDLLAQILEKKQYGKEVWVAFGTHPEDGRDGEFEYLFDTSPPKKPKVLPDGSVDYRTLTNIPLVLEGAMIARYRPPTVGTDGMTLYGVVVHAKNGKEQPPLRGKGFTMSEDKRMYTAAVSGKIELENGRVMIKNVLEVTDDVDELTGNIDFNGDVVIFGNVSAGKKVRATGDLTIDGTAEGCELYAGGNIVLTRGMQGGGTGYAECKGSISGKFFEQMQIVAGKNVNANSLLNCRVEAEGDIEVAGRHGVILGGTVYAGHRIGVTNIGNPAEVQSEVIAGRADVQAAELQKLEEEHQELLDQLQKTKFVLKLFDENEKNAEFSQERKTQVMRLKISLDGKLNENTQKRQRLTEKLILSQEAQIKIRQSAYPGTKVRINGALYQFNEVTTGITLKKVGTEVKIYAD